LTFKLGNNLNIYRVYYVHENEAKSISKTTLFFEDEVKNAASAKYYKQRIERELGKFKSNSAIQGNLK
jgi:hypothetical protein